MRKLKITVTNYVGADRDYIQCLVEQTGAQFTKSMSRDNTHLICAAKHGAKYEKALEWNIEVVNHLWIEEIYQSQQIRPVSRTQYQHFPVIPNQLLETVGSTPIRREYVIEELHKLEAAAVAASAPDLPSVPSQGVAPGTSKGSAKRPAEPQLFKTKRTKSATSLSAAGTGGADTPRSTGMTSGGGSGPLTPPTPATPADLGDDQILKRNHAAQFRATRKGSKGVFIAGTRFNLEPYRKDLERLGAEILPSSQRNVPFEKLTHLIANSLDPKTEKILFCIIHGKHIVTSDWVTASLEAGRFLDESTFALKDAVHEAQFDMNLETSLSLARARPVFEGKTIFEYEVETIFLNLARAAGAKIVSVLKVDVARDGPALQNNLQAFVVVKHAPKLQRIRPLLNSLRKRFLPLRVHYPDLILNAVTKQVIEPHLYTCFSWVADQP